VSRDAYRLRRRIGLAAIAELRRVRNGDERHWLRSLQQRSLASLRAAHFA
jgi:hypothetical protein